MDCSIGNKKNKFSYSMLGISLLFYLFFVYYDGVTICVDSYSYVSMSLLREPFYPALLAIFRFVFGAETDFYLWMIVFVQSILAAVAAWSLADFLYRKLELPKGIYFGILAVPLFVSLLCRFAALRSSMYSNSILSEGITISLYLILFRELLEYLYERTKKSLVLLMLLSVIMISTRKQMLVSLAMIALVVLAVEWCQKKWKKGILKVFLISLFLLIAVALFDRGYNYIVRGEPVKHSGYNRFILTMIFYTAGERDADYIEDVKVKSLFSDIYSKCEEGGFLGSSTEKGWYSEVTHFGDYYDRIQIDTMWPIIYEHVDAGKGNEIKEKWKVRREQEAEAMMNKMIVAVLPHDFTRIVKVLGNNFLAGLVTTVARKTPVLVWYSAMAYLGYILLLLYNIKINGMSKVNQMAILSLLSIVINVFVVSLVIFCQTRYTIYNMPLFYISGLLLLYEIWGKKIHSRKKAVY